jgi:hypothetical protein
MSILSRLDYSSMREGEYVYSNEWKHSFLKGDNGRKMKIH